VISATTSSTIQLAAAAAAVAVQSDDVTDKLWYSLPCGKTEWQWNGKRRQQRSPSIKNELHLRICNASSLTLTSRAYKENK